MMESKKPVVTIISQVKTLLGLILGNSRLE